MVEPPPMHWTTRLQPAQPPFPHHPKRLLPHPHTPPTTHSTTTHTPHHHHHHQHPPSCRPPSTHAVAPYPSWKSWQLHTRTTHHPPSSASSVPATGMWPLHRRWWPPICSGERPLSPSHLHSCSSRRRTATSLGKALIWKGGEATCNPPSSLPACRPRQSLVWCGGSGGGGGGGSGGVQHCICRPRTLTHPPCLALPLLPPSLLSTVRSPAPLSGATVSDNLQAGARLQR